MNLNEVDKVYETDNYTEANSKLTDGWHLIIPPVVNKLTKCKKDNHENVIVVTYILGKGD